MAFLMLIALLAAGGVPAARAEAPAPDQQTARFEVRFMEDMIDHHTMAVMMAEMCVDRAVHPDLRSLCEQIIAAQSQEIEMMQGWLQDWYGISYEPEVPRGQELSMQRQAMRLSPEEFEIWFMRNMIRHHRQAIREAEGCLDRAYHGDLLQLCQNIIETQSAEIEQMQAWLCEWYDIWRPNSG